MRCDPRSWLYMHDDHIVTIACMLHATLDLDRCGAIRAYGCVCVMTSKLQLLRVVQINCESIVDACWRIHCVE